MDRKERRELAGLTLQELVDNARVSRPTVYRWQRGEKIDQALVARIERALDAAEAARATPAPGTDEALRADVAALRAEVAALSRQVFELLEHERLTVGASGKQPGGLQGLQVPPASRRSPA